MDLPHVIHLIGIELRQACTIELIKTERREKTRYEGWAVRHMWLSECPRLPRAHLALSVEHSHVIKTAFPIWAALGRVGQSQVPDVAVGGVLRSVGCILGTRGPFQVVQKGAGARRAAKQRRRLDASRLWNAGLFFLKTQPEVLHLVIGSGTYFFSKKVFFFMVFCEVTNLALI